MQRLLVTVLAMCLFIGQAFAQVMSPTGLSHDIGGTVTAGGSYQTIEPANSLRKNCTVENPVGSSETLNVKLGTMVNPYTLAAGQAISTASGIAGANDAITVTAATTSHTFAGTCQ